MAKKITKLEKKFCKVYVKTRDYTQTKLKLGYDVNINKKVCLDYIKSRPIKLQFEVKDDPILRRLYAIATFDHTQMYDKDGDVKPRKSLTEEQKMAIRSYTEYDNGTVTFTTFDTQRALEALAKHKALLDPIKEAEDEKPIQLNLSIDPRSNQPDE